jgi:hypothetical protein
LDGVALDIPETLTPRPSPRITAEEK